MKITKGKYKSSIEAEFALRLRVWKQEGMITEWEYEPRSFVIGRAIKHFGNRGVEEVICTPDFWYARREGDRGVIVEIKGPKIWPIDRLRFKVAAYMYRHEFEWQMWQKTKKGVWKRLY